MDNSNHINYANLYADKPKEAILKYVKSGIFSTKQFSIDETLTEIDDIVTIASCCIKQGDLKLVETNLKEVDTYIKHIRHKVEIALKYVPADVQEREFL